MLPLCSLVKLYNEIHISNGLPYFNVIQFELFMYLCIVDEIIKLHFFFQFHNI